MSYVKANAFSSRFLTTRPLDRGWLAICGSMPCWTAYKSALFVSFVRTVCIVTFLRRILVGREDKCIAEHDWIDARESHSICHDPARSGGGGSQPKQRSACRGVLRAPAKRVGTNVVLDELGCWGCR